MLEKTRRQDIEERLEDLSASSPRGTFTLKVRDLARELMRAGYTREEILEAFERFSLVLQDRGQEELEDELVDVMDQLEGWCSPHARI